MKLKQFFMIKLHLQYELIKGEFNYWAANDNSGWQNKFNWRIEHFLVRNTCPKSAKKINSHIIGCFQHIIQVDVTLY